MVHLYWAGDRKRGRALPETKKEEKATRALLQTEKKAIRASAGRSETGHADDVTNPIKKRNEHRLGKKTKKAIH